LGIDLSTQNLQQLCAVLNEFALPRAIVDFEHHSFVAWNSKFLEETDFSEDEIKTSQVEELLTFGESWFPLSDENDGQPVEYIACAAKRPFGADPAPGFAVRSQGKIGYVMLDVFDASSAQFEQGRNAGREEEDPFERTPSINGETLNNLGGGYMNDFYAREFWRFVLVQKTVADLAKTAIDYPPMQDPASFNLEAVKKQIDEMIKAHNGE
jgi:hypothetical protein